MLLSVAVPIVLPMPTTKVGKPAVSAAATAAIAPGESSADVLPPPGMQFGKPSVASRRYFGFVSVSPCMMVTAFSIATRVGVLLPGPTRPIAVMIALALFGPTGTSAVVLTLQPVLLVAKNFSPQFTVVSVMPMTMLSAVVV